MTTIRRAWRIALTVGESGETVTLIVHRRTGRWLQAIDMATGETRPLNLYGYDATLVGADGSERPLVVTLDHTLELRRMAARTGGGK